MGCLVPAHKNDLIPEPIGLSIGGFTSKRRLDGLLIRRRRRLLQGHNGRNLDTRLADMFGEEILINREIVVAIATAGDGAAAEGQPLMAHLLLADVPMAEKAVIGLHGQANLAGDLRLVLAVAGDAERGVELGQPVRIGRIGELLRRV